MNALNPIRSDDGNKWSLLCPGAWEKPEKKGKASKVRKWHAASICQSATTLAEKGIKNEWHELDAKGEMRFKFTAMSLNDALKIMGNSRLAKNLKRMPLIPAPPPRVFVSRQRQRPRDVLWESNIFVGIASYRSGGACVRAWRAC